jgi:hypothetical protein
MNMTLDRSTTSLDGDLSLDDQDLEAMMSQHQHHHHYHKSSSSSFRHNTIIVPDTPLTEQDILGRNETRKVVHWIKAMGIALLTVLAMTVCILLFLHLKQQERTAFQRHYYDSAQRIVTTVQTNVQGHKNDLENLSIHIQSLTKAAAAASSSYYSQQQQQQANNDSGTGDGNSTSIASHVTTTTLSNLSSSSRNQNDSASSWPFVTVPDFDFLARARTTTTTTTRHRMIGSTLISVVQPSQRQAYEAYSVQNQEWIQEGLERQQRQQQADTTSNGNAAVASSSSSVPEQLFPPFIYRHHEDKNGSSSSGVLPIKEEDMGPGPYFPIRHLAPLIRPELVNYNVAVVANTTSSSNDSSSASPTTTTTTTTAFGDAVWEAYHSGKVVLGKILRPEDDDDDVINKWLQESLSWQPEERHRDKTNNHETALEGPVSSLYYPILVDDVVVGLLTEFMAWSSVLSNIFVSSPSNENDISNDGSELYYLAVLENSCAPQQTYTFHLKGSTVELDTTSPLRKDNGGGSSGGAVVGGDVHDPTYDSMRYSYSLNDVLEEEQNGDDDDDDDSYLDVPRLSWNTEYCPYTLHVYPTVTLEDSFSSKLPLLYTLAVALVYVFAIIVFLTYDCMVEQRHQKVLQVALESSAIVQTLYPPGVRERLFEQQRKVTGQRVRTMMGSGGGGDGGSSTIAGRRRVGSTAVGSGAGVVGGSTTSDRPRTSGAGRSSSNTTSSILGSGASRKSGATFGGAISRSSGPGASEGGIDVRQVSFRLGKGSLSNGPGGRGATRFSDLELDEGDLANYDESHRRGDDDDPSMIYAPNNSTNNSTTNNHTIGPGTLLPMRSRLFMNQSTARLKSFLSVCEDSSSVDFKPIADMFPHTTVLFADICGFTSWSSQREPEKVFTLLQAIFNAFDMAARKRSVFKVETIGDCYVAATGLPDPQEDHAWRMCKFALECRSKMTDVTRDLEVTLG